jgi:hypothetical protein
MIEEEVEECWGEDTSLTDAVVDAECLRDMATGFASVEMELSEKALKFTRALGLFKDGPQCETVDVRK